MMTVDRLRKECKKNLLHSKGTKVELVERLNANEKDKKRMKIETKSLKRVRDDVDENPTMGMEDTTYSFMSPLKKPKTLHNNTLFNNGCNTDLDGTAVKVKNAVHTAVTAVKAPDAVNTAFTDQGDHN